MRSALPQHRHRWSASRDCSYSVARTGRTQLGLRYAHPALFDHRGSGWRGWGEQLPDSGRAEGLSTEIWSACPVPISNCCYSCDFCYLVRHMVAKIAEIAAILRGARGGGSLFASVLLFVSASCDKITLIVIPVEEVCGRSVLRGWAQSVQSTPITNKVNSFF
jgi:hypothetical protein